MFGFRFHRARVALAGSALAALALTGAVLPAAPAMAAEQPTAATLAPSLVGRWLHTAGDCADFCTNLNQQYQFYKNAQYAFAEEHRDQYNYGGRFCVDDRPYYEAGSWFTNGSFVYTTPTVAIAQHTNTCDPSSNSRKLVSLLKSYFRWQ